MGGGNRKGAIIVVVMNILMIMTMKVCNGDVTGGCSNIAGSGEHAKWEL